MKRVALSFLMFVAALSLSAEQTLAEQTKLTGPDAIAKFPARLQNSEIAHLVDASWCQLMPGVEYFYGKFDLLYNTTANDVSFFKIDYKNAPLRMKFVDNRRNGGSNKQTSYVANKYNALFGINCTFPAWYAKMEGTVVNNGNKEGGLALNDDKTFEFFKSNWWTDHPNAEGYTDAFSTEAMGLYHGSQSLSGTTWGQAPYTFMGATQDGGTIYVCVVDGRTTRSQGLGYGTTHSFLIELGCYDGMCIDGGGSTTMVCRKDLMPSGMNTLQHVSEGSTDHYTMNFTINSSSGSERAVCNQLLFVEDVANVTMDFSRHGSCSLGTGTVKFGKNSTQNYTVTADPGYQIAYLAYQGQSVDAAKGKTSYSGSFLADGDKTITATFVKKTAWWLKPKVVNDFAVAKYTKKNIYDGAAVAVDENNQNVYFGLSTHSYSSASNGVVGYAVADLVDGKSTPTCGTRAMYNDAGVTLSTEYVKGIAVSATAKALLVGRKTGATDQHAIICPLGKSWGDPEYVNYNSSAKDARFLLQNDINFNDGEKTSVTQDSIFQCAFTPDGKRLYAAAGYAGNGSRYVLEYNVQTDASGAMTGIQPTGKIIKFSTTVFSLACGKVNGKDILFGTDTNGMLGMIAPDDFNADGSGFVSSTAQARYEKLGKFTGMCVTGADDGTPRLIGSVAKGQFSVYDIKPDGSGLVSTTPIVTYDHYATFDNTGMDAFACTSDDQTAFFSYTVIGEGNRQSLYAKVVQADVADPGEEDPELIPVAKPTATTGLVYNGSAQTGVAAATGYTVENGSETAAGSYTATVTLAQGYCWADESTTALSLGWSIGKKDLTVTPTAVVLSYGDEKPTTFAFDIAGFALSDTQSVVKGEPTFTCDYEKGSDVGAYDIAVNVGGLSADNYTFAGVKGTLTISQKTPTLSDVSATAITYGQTLADSVVTATVTPSIAGTFAWADASIAPTVADGGVTVYEGTFTPSDAKNYQAAAFSTTVAVNRKEIAVPTANTGLVFNFSEQTGVASGEGYTLSGEKATAAGDYVATAALTDKANTCWADDKTTDDKEIAWSIAESTPEVSGTAKAGVDWNGSEVTLDIENLNLGSHALEDLAATLEVNGKSYDGAVTAQGAGAYRVSFAVDATGANAVVATNGYEGAYRVTLAGGTDDPVVVVSGTQDVLQGMPATATNGWFHETAATLGQTGAWTKGGEAAEPTTEGGRLVIEPTGTSTLDFVPATEMNAGTKGVVEASLLFEGPCDEDDVAPAGGQCAVRIAEDDDTGAVKLQVYAALSDGDGGWNVGWHDWNQPEAETYSFVVGTEYAIRLVCDYETGSNALKCFVKQAGADGYVLLFSGYLTGVSEGAGAPKRIATLGFEGTGKVSVLDGTFTRDFLDASVATVGGVKYATVADAVAAGGQVTLLWDASWSPNGPGDYVFAKGGHNLVIGGALAYQVKDNGDGTVTVTVAGDDPDAPVPASIVLKDGKVAIGVANPEAKRRYCLARAAKLGDEFVPDDTTWKTGEELLDGALLEVPVKSGATSEFFKVVVK